LPATSRSTRPPWADPSRLLERAQARVVDERVALDEESYRQPFILANDREPTDRHYFYLPVAPFVVATWPLGGTLAGMGANGLYAVAGLAPDGLAVETANCSNA